MRTRHLSLVTHEHSVTVTKTLTAYSPYGPVRAGLTTWPDQETLRESQLVQLTELLNSLERKVASLNYKSFTVLDTLTTATKEMLAEPLPSTINTGGIDV